VEEIDAVGDPVLDDHALGVAADELVGGAVALADAYAPTGSVPFRPLIPS
jgi:hypothetical protein